MQRPGDKLASLLAALLHEDELEIGHLFGQAQLKRQIPLALQYNLLGNNLAHPQQQIIQNAYLKVVWIHPRRCHPQQLALPIQSHQIATQRQFLLRE